MFIQKHAYFPYLALISICEMLKAGNSQFLAPKLHCILYFREYFYLKSIQQMFYKGKAGSSVHTLMLFTQPLSHCKGDT